MALTEHQKRLIEQEKLRQAFIKKCQTIPEITDEMKAIEVNLGTLYVDQHPECPRFASEVFLTSKVKLGNFSRAAYNKVLELAPLSRRRSTSIPMRTANGQAFLAVVVHIYVEPWSSPIRLQSLPVGTSVLSPCTSYGEKRGKSLSCIKKTN